MKKIKKFFGVIALIVFLSLSFSNVASALIEDPPIYPPIQPPPPPPPPSK